MTTKLTRRGFAKATLATGTGIGLATPALAQGGTELRMLMCWPKNFPGLGTSAERFAERVNIASNGALRINVFGAGEIVAPFEVLDAVAAGAGDMSHDTSYYWFGKDPAFVYFATVPFGLTADEHFTWLKFGGGQELWDKLGAEHGVKPLAVLNTGAQMGGWFKDEIKSADDLQGLRVRYPGLGGQMLAELGATPTNIPGGELYTALDSGTIDGLEWIAPWNDLAFGFHRAAKHYYYPGFHEMGHSISTYINAEVWSGLSEQEKTILQTAADAEYGTSLAEYNARNLAALNTLVDEHGVQLHQWPDDIIAKMQEIAPGIIKASAASSPLATEIHASWVGFRNEQKRWGEIGEYFNARLKQG
ncbi:ABC transporter substrate-binding protein (plasmid) [Phaeobacter inhibens]|uniref:TRAP transporter substrate-binding protein n=1 Tax=Phaeobacter inhibens TaxID=221822 RepID=UPI000971843E|nr:TRAP transporter substrate-binding protein [Phaeobacter inhibens]APX18143.1 ABC transporter substrate-binding protein [Phaeobacter inhibens]